MNNYCFGSQIYYFQPGKRHTSKLIPFMKKYKKSISLKNSSNNCLVRINFSRTVPLALCCGVVARKPVYLQEAAAGEGAGEGAAGAGERRQEKEQERGGRGRGRRDGQALVVTNPS